MSFTIHRVSLMDDAFSRKLGWDDVIGLAPSNQINIEIEVEAAGTPAPGAMTVFVSSRLPNKTTGAGLASSLEWYASPVTAPASSPGRKLFRISNPISSAGPFLTKGKNNDVATIVRDGGTSDQKFRDALGWTSRGIATQPTTVGASTGNEAAEIPDALSLFKAGGVEVLEVNVDFDSSWTVHIWKVKRLIRKPCKIVYYTGHGLSWQNCLGIETGPDEYKCWATASDLVGNWTKGTGGGSPPEIFIIAGCSLLRYRPAPGANPKETIGLAWADLLASKKGPLTTLLGYADSAPSDKTAGDALATEMGGRIARGSTDLVTDWLELNGLRKAWNATAMNDKGYFWIEPREGTFYGHKDFARTDIKGPRPIP